MLVAPPFKAARSMLRQRRPLERRRRAGLKPGASAPESALGRRGESPLQVNVTCSRLQLRRRKTRWRAAGGERPVRRITNSIRPARRGEPASEWRSPEFPLGGVPWGCGLGPIRRQVTCLGETKRPQVVGDGMVGRPSVGIRETCSWGAERVAAGKSPSTARTERAGVRASIVAKKGRNGPGAKGRRKVDGEQRGSEHTPRPQCLRAEPVGCSTRRRRGRALAL